MRCLFVGEANLRIFIFVLVTASVAAEAHVESK